jgi:PAS domain S-box-containing protein
METRQHGVPNNTAERKQMEEVLRECEERLSSIYNTFEDAIFDLKVEAEGQYRFAAINQSFCRVTGLSREQVVGRTVTEVIREPSLTMALGKYRQAIEAKTIVRWEEVSEYPAGRLIGEVRVAPVFDNMGKCTHLVGSVHDVAGSKRAEESSIEAHRRLAAAIDAIPGLVFEVDVKGRIYNYYAPATETPYRQPEEFLGKLVGDVLPPDATDVIIKALTQAATKGLHRAATYALNMPSGRRWFELSIVTKPGCSAPDVRFIALARDVTEQHRAEMETQLLRQELAHYSRVETVSALTASIAHELNQPLAAILSNAQAALRLMRGGSLDLKELREILDDIVADDNRAAAVIRSVRSLLKKDECESHPLLLNDLITDVLPIVRNDALIKGVSITLDLSSPMPPVKGNRIQLQQVILNLVINAFEAIEASEGHRNLVIRTRQGEGTMILDVSDSGPGIPSDKIVSIFEPFVTTKTTGLGIGLPLSRSIVTAHEGRLWAENNSEGGATFHMALPVAELSLPIPKEAGLNAEIEKQAHSVPAIYPDPGRKIRLLLADDHAIVRQGIAKLLSHEPHIEIVGAAASGQEAVKLASKLLPDTILMDIDMPGLSGIEATRIIHKEHPGICIIGLSMFEEADKAQTMRAAGAADYFTKSCYPEALINAISKSVQAYTKALSAKPSC